MTSEMPSMKYMGSEVKVRRAFPYHPLQDLYECHLEESFTDYENHLFKKDWIVQKAKHERINAKKFRFRNRKHAFAHYLQYKWMADKKYECLQRYTGLREEPYWRQYTRSKCINNYSNLILWCKHWNCWRIRFRNLHWVPFVWFKFWLHTRQNPDLIDIH